MKTRNICFLLIISSYFSFSQKLSLKIIDLKPSKQENIFPEVFFANKPKISEKINVFLQLEYLSHLPNKFDKNPFVDVTYSSNSSGITSLMGWKIKKNTANILSLEISGETTGAYSEYFERYENFDLRNGNLILIKNLFNKNNQNLLAKKINLVVKKTISDYLKEIKLPKKNKVTKEEQDTFGDQILLYESCLKETEDYKLDLEYYKFYFNKTGITFVCGRCSNHAMRAIDDLDTYSINLTNKEIDKYLTVYGRNLINGSQDSSTTNSPEGKLFKGKINDKYLITALINRINNDGSLEMKYWYDKVKQPIELDGKFENNHFSLNENTNDLKSQETSKTGSIEADFINPNKIIGTWTNESTKEILKLELEEY